MSRKEAANKIKEAEIKQIIAAVYEATVICQALRSAFCILKFWSSQQHLMVSVIIDEGTLNQKC